MVNNTVTIRAGAAIQAIIENAYLRVHLAPQGIRVIDAPAEMRAAILQQYAAAIEADICIIGNIIELNAVEAVAAAERAQRQSLEPAGPWAGVCLDSDDGN